MNSTSEQRLSKVHPELARRVQLLIAAMLVRGHVVEVVQGLRTFAEQEALYAQGRTKPGPRVTNARGGQSNHNYGLACDLCPFVAGKPDWNAAAAVWIALGEEARRVGLEWGGDWKRFQDRPHVQLPGLSITQCQSLYMHGHLAAVWREASKRLQPLTA